MKLIAILLCLSVAGCCNPKTIIKTQEVPMPYPVKCKVDRPTPPGVTVVKSEPKGPGLYYKGQLVLNELEEQRRYANELEKALAVCSE